MATLIPALGACLSRMTAGERRRCELFSFEGVGIRVQGCTTGPKFDCRNTKKDESAQAPDRWRRPYQVRNGSGSVNTREDTIQLQTAHASKGLESLVMGQMPTAEDDERDEASLYYVGRRSAW